MPYLLLTDETNQQPSERARFFIYGGVFFPAEVLPELDELVRGVRADAGYRRGDELKFDTRSRPDHVTRQQHTAAKRRLLEGAADLNVRFLAYLVLHDIARNRPLEQLVRFGVNTVLSTFHRFLEVEDEYGLCLVDRLPFRHGHQSLGEVFQHGLQMPNNRRRVLDRVLMLSETTQQESFVSSIVDVVLGSFRYCVNERQNERATRAILPAVVQMMWSRRAGDAIYVREYGLLFRPLNVAVPAYQAEYEELTNHFAAMIEAAD